MALVKCPVCRTKMSSLAPVCPKCGFSHDSDAKIDPEQAELYRKRRYAERSYQLTMLSYVAMAIAMIGAVPMLWDYIQGLEQGKNVVLLEHWGSYLVAAGFVFYMVIRVVMIQTRKNHRSK
ncbi:hypothetical protein [Marinicella gelatinilytica]|uniref:hypothetical protein n=1 Tax=Marinicella gelatinilytica TaxID=2996017 RepID=UPI00226081D8|nr:hypothetical protein [Marinicella gelatinilytica]MCX7545047.1 hypothetical protein [Marinicella gelatinilytica]